MIFRYGDQSKKKRCVCGGKVRPSPRKKRLKSSDFEFHISSRIALWDTGRKSKVHSLYAQSCSALWVETQLKYLFSLMTRCHHF